MGVLQRMCKGYLVSKRFFRERAKISINASLMQFTEQRNAWGTQLSNLVRFHWRIHMRVKKKKAEKEAKKKAAAKKGAKKGFKKAPSTTVSPAKATPARRESVAKPDLKKATSTTSGKAEPKDSKKEDTLKTPKQAAPLSKTMTTPAKINVDDLSMSQ